jgi:FkbM family methyltransferase
LFAKPLFIKWNKFLYNLSIRGLGILNYRTELLRGEKDWLNNYLSNFQNPFIIDVGANVGNYSKDIMDINANAKIVAIEPHPITYNKLKSNLLDFKNVKLYNYAVGMGEGEILELFDYKNNDGSSHASLYKNVITDLHKGEVVSHKVKIKKLEDLIDINKTIDLLKIDTEGNEYNVLLGAKEFLNKKQINAIHFEFNEMNIISKTTFKDFWELLHDDYNLYRILPYGKLLEIKNYLPIHCEIYHYQNIVALLKN